MYSFYKPVKNHLKYPDFKIAWYQNSHLLIPLFEVPSYFFSACLRQKKFVQMLPGGPLLIIRLALPTGKGTVGTLASQRNSFLPGPANLRLFPPLSTSHAVVPSRSVLPLLRQGETAMISLPRHFPAGRANLGRVSRKESDE